MIGLSLEGWDGSVWDLRTGSVRVTADGIEGLGNLEFDVFTQDTAQLDGQRMTGWRGKPRDFLLPVMIGPFRDETQFMRLSKSWWKIMHPQKVNTLTITAPDGTTRMLDIRFVNDGGAGMKKDPTRDLLDIWPIRMVADQPWYYGEDFGKDYRPGTSSAVDTGKNFFGGLPVSATVDGKGTPLFLSPSKIDDVTTFRNPGDTDVWPVYEFDAGMTRFKATIGAGVIEGSGLTVPAGSKLVVETSPLRQVANLVSSSGVRTNITRKLSQFGFRPLPAGSSTVLKLEVTSTGNYRVRAVPYFFRGW